MAGTTPVEKAQRIPREWGRGTRAPPRTPAKAALPRRRKIHTSGRFTSRSEAAAQPCNSGELAPLARWPERLRERPVGRVDGHRHAVLPLRENHRHVLAASLLVEVDRPGITRRGDPLGEVQAADRFGDLELVGHPGAFQRLLEDPHVAVTGNTV